MVADEKRRPNLLLEFDQEKSLQTDRVIFVCDPHHEVETVREIFRLFVHNRTPPSYIAKAVNAQNMPNAWGQSLDDQQRF